MKFLKFFSFILILSTLFNCATKVPLAESFYNDKTVGVYVVSDSINRFKSGSQGLLDMAISSGAKYKEPLQYIGSQIDAKSLFVSAAQSTLSEKSKSYIIIDDKIDFEGFSKFEKPDSKDKTKYSSKNLTALKNKYNVDQLMIVHIKYGLTIGYYSMVETGKGGSAYISVEVIDLNTNELLYKDNITTFENFTGQWKNPPYYPELKENIEKALNIGVDQFNTKF